MDYKCEEPSGISSGIPREFTLVEYCIGDIDADMNVCMETWAVVYVEIF